MAYTTPDFSSYSYGEYNNGVFTPDATSDRGRATLTSNDPNATDLKLNDPVTFTYDADGSTEQGTFQGYYSDGTVDYPFFYNIDAGNYYTLGSLQPGQSYTITAAGYDGGAVCFAPGTLIRTASGDVAVEDLQIGDLVVTASGKQRPIKWIGVQRVDCRRARTPENIRPIRFCAGALAPGLPQRDLLVSPEHAFYFDDVLIPAWALINGSTVQQIEAGEVSYYGIELDSHDMVLAEGVAAESFLDDGMGNRNRFDNHANDQFALDVHKAITREDAYRPRVVEGPHVAMARAWIDARAAYLGQPAVYGSLSEVIGSNGHADDDAVRPAVEGCIERVSCDRVSGWAWMPERPKEAVTLEVLLNGEVIARFAADKYRDDLKGGPSDGRRSFDFRLPPAAFKGDWAQIEVRVCASGQQLDNSPVLASTQSTQAKMLV